MTSHTPSFVFHIHPIYIVLPDVVTVGKVTPIPRKYPLNVKNLEVPLSLILIIIFLPEDWLLTAAVLIVKDSLKLVIIY
jgi:hypothetical protein